MDFFFLIDHAVFRSIVFISRQPKIKYLPSVVA